MQEDVLFQISNGLFVISATHKDKPDTYAGSLVDTVCQISINPHLLILSCTNNSYTKECIEHFGEFGISILPRNINPFVVANFGFQSSRNINKWQNIPHIQINNLPYLTEALGKIRAKVIETRHYNCNTLFIAEIVDAFDYAQGEPLTYRDYRSDFKNKAQEAFSDYQNNSLSETTSNNLAQQATTPAPQNTDTSDKKHWVCTVCGYVYDGEIPFEALPEDWLCPLCGVGKEFFELR